MDRGVAMDGAETYLAHGNGTDVLDGKYMKTINRPDNVVLCLILDKTKSITEMIIIQWFLQKPYVYSRTIKILLIYAWNTIVSGVNTWFLEELSNNHDFCNGLGFVQNQRQYQIVWPIDSFHIFSVRYISSIPLC